MTKSSWKLQVFLFKFADITEANDNQVHRIRLVTRSSLRWRAILLRPHTTAALSNKNDFCKASSSWQQWGTATANDKLMVTIHMCRCRDQDTHHQLPGWIGVAMETTGATNKSNRSPYTILTVIIAIIRCRIIQITTVITAEN